MIKLKGTEPSSNEVYAGELTNPDLERGGIGSFRVVAGSYLISLGQILKVMSGHYVDQTGKDMNQLLLSVGTY